MKTHLFITWLLANLLHPIIFVVAFLVQGNEDPVFINPASIAVFLYMLFIFSLLSIPSLIISLLLGEWMNNTRLSSEFVYGIWLLLSPVIVLANFVLILLFAEGGRILPDMFLFAVPGIIAAVLASLFRSKAFFNKMSQLKSMYNETTMV